MKWTDVSRRLLGAWPGQVAAWGRQGIEAYVEELQRRGLTPESASAALDRYSGTFPPSAPELAALAPGTGYSTPVQAWALIEEAIRKFGTSIYAEDFDVKHQAAVDWLAERDTVVAYWAAKRGLFQARGSLGQEEVNGDFGGAVRTRLEKEYATVVAEVQERGLLGKPLSRKELTVRGAREGGGGMAEVVNALRPAAQIGESSESG